jgi:rhamnogalacturonan endolyase
MIHSKRPVYFSMGGGKLYRQPRGAEFRLIRSDADHAEVAFLQKWDQARHGNQAVDMEVRYILRRGDSGVYTYGVLNHPSHYPDGQVGEWRMVWGMPTKNNDEWLMEKICVDEMRHWEMPTPADLAKAKRTPIAEIVELTSGKRAGKYDCKYEFNLEYYRVGCWGHASDRHKVGAWVVLGSHEFFNDGPMKQDLSSASSVIHIHFGMNHYAGSSTRLQAGKAWQKMSGPYLLYVNQGENVDAMWRDARARSMRERSAWPYDWVKRDDLYPSRAARAVVTGSLQVTDALKPAQSSAGCWVGLAQPEEGGNFQAESNGYQYWTKTDKDGRFVIPHVRPGGYTLSVFGNGIVGDWEKRQVTIRQGKNDLGVLDWQVPRLGKKLVWEIGIPDRRAAEFQYADRFFHCYLWHRFSQELPNPLVYQVGQSTYAKDWGYAQGAYMVNGKPVAWPWIVRFPLAQAPARGDARLILAIASAHRARLEVKINGKVVKSFYPSCPAGNTLLRQSSHAKYQLVNIDFPANLLQSGDNEISLTQMRQESAAVHIMYDYLALELPE